MTEQDRTMNGPGRWLVWMIASTLGLLVGLLVSFTLIFAASGPQAPGALLAIMGALVAGFAIGLGQYVTLRLWKQATLSNAWLWTTGAGFALVLFLLVGSDAVVNVDDRTLGVIQLGGAAAAALAMIAAQWLVLRNRFGGAGWWAAAGAGSLIVAALVSVLSGDALAGMLLGWIVYAASGGGVMVWLLARQVSVITSPPP